jgi:hypothetical protein
VPIATIDLVYDQKAGNQYGVPALLAVTAASARQ